VVKRSETTGNPHQHRVAAPAGRENPVRALLAPLPGCPSFRNDLPVVSLRSTTG